VTWDEVEQALKKKDPQRLVFDAKNVLARVDKMGDLYEPVVMLKQNLPQLAGLVGAEKEDVSLAAQAEPPLPSSKKKAVKKAAKKKAVPRRAVAKRGKV